MIMDVRGIRERVTNIGKLVDKDDFATATKEEWYLHIDTLYALRDDMEVPEWIRSLVIAALSTRSLTYKRELK